MGFFGIGKKKWEAQVRAAEEAAAPESEERSLSEKVMEQQQWEESLRKFVRTESQRTQGQRVVEENARHTATSQDFFEEHDHDSTSDKEQVPHVAKNQTPESITGESGTQTQELEDDYESDADDVPAQYFYDDEEEEYDASTKYEDDEEEDEETHQARVKDYMTRLGLTNDQNSLEQQDELVTDETVLLRLRDTPEDHNTSDEAHTTVTEPETYAGALPIISVQKTGASVQEPTDTGHLNEADDSKSNPHKAEHRTPESQESAAGTVAPHQSPSIADEVAFSASDNPAEPHQGAASDNRLAQQKDDTDRFEKIPLTEFDPSQSFLKKPSENSTPHLEDTSRSQHDDAKSREEETRSPESSAAETTGTDEPVSTAHTPEPMTADATAEASAADPLAAGSTGNDTHHTPEPIFDAPDVQVLTPNHPLYTLIEMMRRHGHGQLTFDLHQVNDDMNYRLYYQGDEIEKGVVLPETVWFDSVAALYIAAQDAGTVWSRALVAASPSLGGRVAVQASYMSATDSKNWEKNYIFPATEQSDDTAATTVAQAEPTAALAENTKPGATPELLHDYDTDPQGQTHTEIEQDDVPSEKTHDNFNTSDEAGSTYHEVSAETTEAASLASLEEAKTPKDEAATHRETTHKRPLASEKPALTGAEATDKSNHEPQEAKDKELVGHIAQSSRTPQPTVEDTDTVPSTEEEPAGSFTESIPNQNIPVEDTQPHGGTEPDNAELGGAESDSIVSPTDTGALMGHNQLGQADHASLAAQGLTPHAKSTAAEAQNATETVSPGAEEEDIDGMAAALAAIVASAENKLQQSQTHESFFEDSTEGTAPAPTVHETVSALNEGGADAELDEDESRQTPSDSAADTDDTGPLPVVPSAAPAFWGEQREHEDTAIAEKNAENTVAEPSRIVNVTSAVAENDTSAEPAEEFLHPADTHTTNLVDTTATASTAADTDSADTEGERTVVEPEAQAPLTGTGALDSEAVVMAADTGTAHRGSELPEHVDDEELVPAVEKESLLAPAQHKAADATTDKAPEPTCSDPDMPTVCADPDTPTVQPAADVSVLSDTKLAEGNLTLTEAQVAHRLAPVVEALFGENGTATDATTVLIRVRALGSYYDALTHVRRNGFWEQVRTFDLVPEETLDIPRLKTDSYSEGEGSPLAISLTFTPGVPVQAAFDYSSEQAFVRYPRQLEAERYVEELRMFPRLGARIPTHMAAALAHWNL